MVFQFNWKQFHLISNKIVWIFVFMNHFITIIHQLFDQSNLPLVLFLHQWNNVLNIVNRPGFQNLVQLFADEFDFIVILID